MGGHCFFNGYKASDNSYLNNLASEIYGVGYGNRLDSQSDYHPGCFVNMYSPNIHVGNVASASGHYGFKFYRHYRELDEVCFMHVLTYLQKTYLPTYIHLYAYFNCEMISSQFCYNCLETYLICLQFACDAWIELREH